MAGEKSGWGGYHVVAQTAFAPFGAKARVKVGRAKHNPTDCRGNYHHDSDRAVAG